MLAANIPAAIAKPSTESTVPHTCQTRATFGVNAGGCSIAHTSISTIAPTRLIVASTGTNFGRATWGGWDRVRESPAGTCSAREDRGLADSAPATRMVLCSAAASNARRTSSRKSVTATHSAAGIPSHSGMTTGHTGILRSSIATFRATTAGKNKPTITVTSSTSRRARRRRSIRPAMATNTE